MVVPGLSVILALSVCSSFTDLSTWLGGMAITVLVMIMAMQAGMPGEIRLGQHHPQPCSEYACRCLCDRSLNDEISGIYWEIIEQKTENR